MAKSKVTAIRGKISGVWNDRSTIRSSWRHRGGFRDPWPVTRPDEKEAAN
jgi:hypothetical protein